ncbi:Putative ABC transporter, ATP-binding protein [Aromatoleum bremense]|uniref:ATP-binding cassette domain-containing protein n=2 Tax=Aromatoleum bremense TaxID=76115 RepID=A0ABX1NZS0_9RHOO|nr:ATP-binding cassette domain-containing protein [Aromatoleum bremense]QTQ32631.1 Putative ABC transporter, ATP-binding protein [Aromatoleum bremense]
MEVARKGDSLIGMSTIDGEVIRVRGLGKCYETYTAPHHRLLDLLWRGPHRRARHFWSLRDLSFSVRRGEAIGIIGRNGAGKSTLLQLLCGTLDPTEGQVQVRGRVAALLELGAGFNPDFTGIENVYLNAAILGLSRAQIDARLADILAFAEIGDFVHEPVKHYSSGMFLRLAFAVVAHVDADVLIVDEALAVGDALFAQKCMRFLREFRSRGVLLLVSHDIPSVTSLCDRALWLEHGSLRMAGTAKDVTEAYLEAVYAERQEVAGLRPNEGGAGSDMARPATGGELLAHDARRDLLIHSNLRNDLEVLPFDAEARGFGTGHVRVNWVGIRDHAERPLAWLVGGEEVMLEVRFEAFAQAADLIVGFMFKDRLGQVLFGENTYLACLDATPVFEAGMQGAARFAFRLPYLPSGEYAISVGIAAGTQEHHVQHHWVHDALVIRCVASHVTHGLLGVPMASIQLQVVHDDQNREVEQADAMAGVCHG